MIVGHLSISDAFAYIDPSSGTLIIQMLAGALIGAGISHKSILAKNQNEILKIIKIEK